MRHDSFTLPTADELWQILDKESPRRTVKFDYLSQHLDLYDGFIELCHLGNVKYDWITGFDTVPLATLVSAITSCINELRGFMLQSPIPGALTEKIFDRLAIEALPQPADVIFVFGSANNARIDKAIELYGAGYAQKLIVSGQGPHYKQVQQAEADRMAVIAEAAGVPRKDIIIENQSITIPDNVKRTLDVFELEHYQPQTMLFVASGFVLRRAAMDWYKFTPWDIQTFPVSATVVNQDYSRSGWQRTSDGISTVLNEYAKIILETKMDQLRAAKT